MKKANYYIKKATDLNNEIKASWAIISHENVSPKTRDRDADLKDTYRKIKDLINQQVQNKLHVQAINSGFKKFGDFPKDNNYLNIFWLSALKDMKRNWEIISAKHTILPSKKRKNKSSLTVSEIYSRATISRMLKDIDTKIKHYELLLTDFNDNTDFDDTGDAIENIFEVKKSKEADSELKAAA